MREIQVSKSGAPLWRKSDSDSHEAGKVRAICTGNEPRSHCYRLAGCKTVVRLPIKMAYELACRLAADAAKPKRVQRTFRRGVLSGV